jgi:carboxyl-terminal processing protease
MPIRSNPFAVIVLILLNLVLLAGGLHLILNDPLFVGMRTVASIFYTIEKHYAEDIDREQLFTSAVDQLHNSLDPYTSYIPPRQYHYYEEESQGEFHGIGVEITVRDGLLTVVSPIAGSPADEAGLRSGDQITMIDDVDATTLDPNDAIDHIRGASGTEVELRIRRPGLDEEFAVKIERSAIQLHSVDFSGMIDSLGYVRLTRFSLNSFNELANSLDSLRREGMRGLILDLRGNPGGFLEIAVAITGLFIPEGELIVSTRGRSFTENFEITNFVEGQYADIPMAVLINGGSASASEILSGALQDYDRAVVIGDTTFGKGLVQNMAALPDGGAFRITVSKYYLPSGRIIQKFTNKEWSRNVSYTDEQIEKTYRTLGGREVYGGGGIVPDIVVTEKEANILETWLVYSGYYFDFAVEYLNGRRDSLSLPLDSSVMGEFRDYLQLHGFDYPFELQQKFRNVEEAVARIDSNLLKTEIIRATSRELEDARNELWRKSEEHVFENLNRIVSNLVFSKTEMYQKYTLRHDPVIKKAREILTDPDLYRQILTPVGS